MAATEIDVGHFIHLGTISKIDNLTSVQDF